MQDFITKFLLKILSIDSTSGKEEKLLNYLTRYHRPAGAALEIHYDAAKPRNIFYKWGDPRIIFCTHLDTVPPYYSPRKKHGAIYGRGACDAKGQIASIYAAVGILHREKQNNFGILLTSGEEIDSSGAKLANELIDNAKFVIVCEPTENKLIKAAKGVLAAEIKVSGKAVHSGYPDLGNSAIDRLRRFLDDLDDIKFPRDKILGKTTYNVGQLHTNNAHNVLADHLVCNILFRTTFTSHAMIRQQLNLFADTNLAIKITNSSEPFKFFTVNGFKTGVVAFCSDAPSLPRLGKCLLYGPGNILDAHTSNEYIKIADVKRAVKDLRNLYYNLVSLL